MADVNLVLKANNSDYVNKMKEAQKATQKVYDTAEKGSKTQLGLIEREIQMQKQLSTSQGKAKNLDQLKLYNQLLADSKNRLNELEKAGLDVEKSNTKLEKSQDGLIKKIGIMAVAYLSVHTVIKALNETVFAFYTKSQEGIHLMEQQVSAFRAGLSVLRGEFIKVGEAINDKLGEASEKGGVSILKKATATAKVFFDIMTGGVFKLVNEKTGLTGYFKDLGTRINVAGEAMKNYTATLQELEDAEIAMIVPRAKATNLIREARSLYAEGNLSLEDRVKYLQKATDEENKQADIEMNHQKKVVANLEIQRDMLIPLKQWLDVDERRYQEAIAKVYELQSESFMRLQRTYGQLKTATIEFRKSITPTSVSGVGFFGMSEDELTKKFAEIDLIEPEILKRGESLIKKSGEQAKRANIALQAEVDAEKDIERKKWESLVSIYREGVSQIQNILQGLADRKFEDAQREREILDQRVSELQQELQTETELYKAGYASNVNAKKVELANTKRLRDQALREEETALKKKQALEAISRSIDIASSIITIIKLAFKNSKTWWAALIAGAAGVAGLFTLLSTSRTQARSSGYAKGGWTGQGEERDHTGERVAGVVHEREFVIRKGPAHRFRDVLEAINRDDKKMIFNRFNKISPELMGGTTVNNVSVNNDGANARLDKLITENRKLNNKLSEGSIINMGDRIVITKGNTVRTIRR